ncbi:Acg family FMN-binding oxidoreductase [Actinomycetospora sp. TBRC 11914]|uniref:Acg family FMN-binding oxidoreductase n=1 Tax=Actinomycetospora sp. TBRC 11914 TaxID=2729387 RepID=UPI00145D2372|nr:nitroreductase [Actinomycetospora sp. TBRC 11914]NMO89456.1 nitroreductase [Actinomycetospora sp. TBRC 11914]
MSTRGPTLDGALGGLDVAALLAAGALAPSSHNAQPWDLRWRGGAVEVHADPARALPVCDPGHRELRLACGAATANVRLALRAQGRRAHVRLLPDPDDPWFLATITVGGPLPATSAEEALAHAIPRRRTDRSPLAGDGVGPRVREEIRRAAQRGRSWAIFVDGVPERRALRELTVRAHERQQSDPAFRAEWDRWVGGGDGDGAGLPRELARRAPRPDCTWRLRDFAASADPDDERPPAAPDDPALLVLATTLDQPIAHLDAGQALQHVLLLATVSGLAASFVAPPVEVGETRAELRRLLGGALWPQVVLRLGVRRRAVPPPPRRRTDGTC